MKLSVDDAVRMALAHNQSLGAQRLNIDLSKADELTASQKPKYTFSGSADGFPLFSPSQINGDYFASVMQYGFAVDHVYERGGKHDKRITTGLDTIDVTSKTVLDAERQLRFQTEQAFVSVQLAKSAARSGAIRIFRAFRTPSRRAGSAWPPGDLAEGDFLKISLQKLQFEQDVSAAELSLVQAKASLRQLLGYDTVATTST